MDGAELALLRERRCCRPAQCRDTAPRKPRRSWRPEVATEKKQIQIECWRYNSSEAEKLHTWNTVDIALRRQLRKALCDILNHRARARVEDVMCSSMESNSILINCFSIYVISFYFLNCPFASYYYLYTRSSDLQKGTISQDSSIVCPQIPTPHKKIEPLFI